MSFNCFQANENLGMVVVFTIVSSVQEKLNQIVEQLAEEQQTEKDLREREREEAEQVWKSTLCYLLHFHKWIWVNKILLNNMM